MRFSLLIIGLLFAGCGLPLGYNPPPYDGPTVKVEADMRVQAILPERTRLLHVEYDVSVADAEEGRIDILFRDTLVTRYDLGDTMQGEFLVEADSREKVTYTLKANLHANGDLKNWDAKDLTWR